jgi:hypothetical protein
VALTVESAVDAKANELFRAFTRDRAVDESIVVPGRSTLRALALGELCREAFGVDVASSKPPKVETTLVVKADDALTSARTLDGRRLSEAAVEVLRCDESVRALVTDAEGVPLWLGRAVRHATAAQRTAIGVRDGGCTFPGCDAPMSWADVHHQPAWEAGGRTDLDVLVALCRRHHRLVHSPGWSMSIDDVQRVAFASPAGRRFWGQRHGRIHAGAEPPRRE